jgi:hypothetical protein
MLSFLSTVLFDSEFLVHDVHTVTVIALGILNEKEIALFILEIDIIGIISGYAFFVNEHGTFIPI